MTTHDHYPQGTPSWVDLSASDPAGAKAFYGALFGWTFDDRPMPDGQGDYSMAFLDGNAVAAVAAQPAQQSAAGAPSTWNVYLAVDDVAAATSAAAAAGGTVLMEPFAMGDSGHLSWVTDPTGAAVGLWQGTGHIGATLTNVPGAVTWNELVTDNPDKALPFLETVLGLTAAPVPMGPDYVYTMLSVGDHEVGGITTPSMPGVPNHWNVWFGTADVDASVATAMSLGGTILVEPMDMPIGRMAVIRDPQGAVVNVFRSGSPAAED